MKSEEKYKVTSLHYTVYIIYSDFWLDFCKASSAYNFKNLIAEIGTFSIISMCFFV